MMARTKRSDRADAITILAVGTGATIVILAWAWRRAAATFLPEGIGWHLQLSPTTISASLSAHAGPVDATVDHGLVVAAGVNAVSVTAIIASLITSTLMALIVIGCVMTLAWNALRGTVFSQRIVRVWDVAGWSLVIGTAVMYACDTFGGNGVLAALDVTDPAVSPTRGFWDFAPLLAVGVTCGLIAIAFRRGLQLQQETEGLI